MSKTANTGVNVLKRGLFVFTLCFGQRSEKLSSLSEQSGRKAAKGSEMLPQRCVRWLIITTHFWVIVTCFDGTKVVVAEGAAFTVAAQSGAHHLTVGTALRTQTTD